MSVLTEWQQRWQRVSRREQRWLLGAVGLVLLALVWKLALTPALAVLRAAPAQHLALDAQLQQMQQLQAQAQVLRVQPVINPADARHALQAALTPLGSQAKLVLQADRASVTLNGVAPEALAHWLADVRQNAHSVPTEAHLVRNAANTWDGTLVLTLPP